MQYHISLQDILLIGGLIISLYQWLANRKLLPAKVNNFVDKLGGLEKIKSVIFQAAALSSADSASQREWAVSKLMEIADQEDIALPEGYARLIVEFAFQRFIKSRL